MAKEKAIEICKNLKNTIKHLTGGVVGNSILRKNNIHSATRPCKMKLKRKLDGLIKEYNINKKDLK